MTISAIVSAAMFNKSQHLENVFITGSNGRGSVNVKIGERSYIMIVRETPDLFIQLNKIIEEGTYWCSCNGKVLRPHIPWSYYGFQPGVTIMVHHRLMGGSKTFYDYKMRYEGHALNPIDWVVANSKSQLKRNLPKLSQRLEKRLRKKMRNSEMENEIQYDTDVSFYLQSDENEADLVGFLAKYLDEDIVNKHTTKFTPTNGLSISFLHSYKTLSSTLTPIRAHTQRN